MILTQNNIDLNILYGEEKTKAILSNLKYKVLLGGLAEPDAQRYFADLIGYKKQTKLSKSKNNKQTTYTESEQKEYKIEPAELDRQGKDKVILIAANEQDGYLKLEKNYYFKDKEPTKTDFFKKKNRPKPTKTDQNRLFNRLKPTFFRFK